MSKIYVVKASGGSYDDAWECNVCAYLDEEKAQFEVWRLNEQMVRLREIHGKIQEAYYRRLKATQKGLEVAPERPRGPVKQTPTSKAEYKAAQKAWQVVADPILKRNQEHLAREYGAAKELARLQAVELGATEEDLVFLGFRTEGTYPITNYNLEATHEYEELELK